MSNENPNTPFSRHPVKKESNTVSRMAHVQRGRFKQPSSSGRQLPKKKMLAAIIILLALVLGRKQLLALNIIKTVVSSKTPNNPVLATDQAAPFNPLVLGVQTTSTPVNNLSPANAVTDGTPDNTTVILGNAKLKVNSTPTGYLNVRDLPSLSGAIVAKILLGQIYPYTKSQNGWYLVSTDTGKSGWVSGQYVTLQ